MPNKPHKQAFSTVGGVKIKNSTSGDFTGRFVLSFGRVTKRGVFDKI